MRVTRPVWRRFSSKFSDRAAEWVHAGGHAVVWRNEDSAQDGARQKSRAYMLLTQDARGKITEAGLWSILALEQQGYRRIAEGAAKGLFRARVASHALDAVADWCDRDAGHENPTREIELDCLECAACCHEANVILDEDDLDRFREAGREDLTKRKYIRRARDGKVTLRFLPSGKCQHLQTDNKCRIYTIRPYNCSVFPVGSEACLAARESTLNLRDDAASIQNP